MVIQSIVQKIFLNTKELAIRWGMSPHTLKKWRLEGKGPQPFNICGRVSYRIEDVEEFERNAGHFQNRRKTT